VVPDLVRVAAAAQVTRQSDGVRQTIQESLSEGVAMTYRDGQVVREAFGAGATVVTFGGALVTEATGAQVTVNGQPA
jgi:hypothetical protein